MTTPNFGNLYAGPLPELYTREVALIVHRPRNVTPPPVEWDRDYGDGPLRECARSLVSAGMSAAEVAEVLRLQYGRQCEVTAAEVDAALKAAEEDGDE